MYPSLQYPKYGIFVKNFEKSLEKNFNVQFTKVVLQYKNSTKSLKLIHYILYFIKCLAKITFNKYDLVYFHYAYHNAPLAIWAKLLNKKIVINAHGTDILFKKSNSFEKLIKIALHKANLIVVPSDFFSTIIKKKYKIDINNILSYPSGGINKDIFNNLDNTIINPELKVAFVSRIDKDKGWDDYIEAVKNIETENQNVSFHLIGNGSENYLMHKKLEQAPFIKLYGELGQREISKILQTCDLFIFPSRLQESLGLVGVEAMACGLPVIGSNIGGIATYIKDNYNGYLFEPGNPKELSQHISNYIKLSIKEKQRLKHNALKTAENFSSDVVSKKLYIRLENLL